jgi:Ca-activated chloride channel family protein
MAEDPVSWLEIWFLHPWLLGLLGLMPVLALGGGFAARRRRRAARAISGPRLGRRLGLTLHRLHALNRWLAITLVIIGAAGPRWTRDPDAPPPFGRDLMVVLDVSRSMLAEDRAAPQDRTSESRLLRAKRELLQLVEGIERRGGLRLGLIAFAGQARVLSPLTEDYDHFRFALELAHPDYLGAATRLEFVANGIAIGTHLGNAIELAVQTHEPGATGFREILLVSDGDDQGHDRQQAIQRARDAGIAVHVLGVGDPEREALIPTGRPDEPFLQFDPGAGQPPERVRTRRHDDLLGELTAGTGGILLKEEHSSHELRSWHEQVIARLPVRERTTDGLPVLRDRSAWFFAAALLLMVLETLAQAVPSGRRVGPALT